MKLVNHSAVKVDPPKLCVLPGEGAAAEAVLSSMKVLETLDLPIETDLLDVKTMSNEEMYRRMDQQPGDVVRRYGKRSESLGISPLDERNLRQYPACQVPPELP